MPLEAMLEELVAMVGRNADDRIPGRSNLFEEAEKPPDPLVGEASGVGLVAGVELVNDKETKENFGPEIAAFCAEACMANGLILRPCAGKRMAVCPPLIIDENQINTLVDRLEAGLNETWDHVQVNA